MWQNKQRLHKCNKQKIKWLKKINLSQWKENQIKLKIRSNKEEKSLKFV